MSTDRQREFERNAEGDEHAGHPAADRAGERNRVRHLAHEVGEDDDRQRAGPRRTPAASPTAPRHRRPSSRLPQQAADRRRGRRRQASPTASPTSRALRCRRERRAPRSGRRGRRRRPRVRSASTSAIAIASSAANRRDRAQRKRARGCARAQPSARHLRRRSSRGTRRRARPGTRAACAWPTRGVRPVRRSVQTVSAAPPAPAVGSSRVAAAPASVICALSRVPILGVARPATSDSSHTYAASDAASSTMLIATQPGPRRSRGAAPPRPRGRGRRRGAPSPLQRKRAGRAARHAAAAPARQTPGA